MKQADVLKILSSELGAANLDEVNKALKAKTYSTKFRITGPTFVHFGFTGLIKALTPEGVKVINVNKVSLVRYEDIETFSKAKPKSKAREKAKEERKALPKGEKSMAKAPAKTKLAKENEEEDFEDDEDYENDDDFDAFADEEDDIIEDDTVAAKIENLPRKKPKKDTLNVPGSGSRFIPKKK